MSDTLENDAAEHDNGKALFVIWSKLGKRPPRMVHSTYTKAVAEAQRLAALRPGQRFFVMRAECSFKQEGEAMTVRQNEGQINRLVLRMRDGATAEAAAA